MKTTTKRIQATDITHKMKGSQIIKGFLKCGDCTGLDIEALISGTKAKCSDEGKLETSRACPKFKPDLFSLRELSEEGDFDKTTQFIAQLLRNIPSDKYGLIASVFLQEEQTVKSGFSFHQPVYVRYRGSVSSNYMSNFMTAYVLNATDKDVRLVSADPRHKQFTLTYDNTGLEGPSIYSSRAFKPLREEMIEKGRHVAPKEERKTTESLMPQDSIDLSKMPSESLDGFTGDMFEVMRANGVKAKSKSKRKMDGMDLVQTIQDGFTRKGKKKKKSRKGSIELSEL